MKTIHRIWKNKKTPNEYTVLINNEAVVFLDGAEVETVSALNEIDLKYMDKHYDIKLFSELDDEMQNLIKQKASQ